MSDGNFEKVAKTLTDNQFHAMQLIAANLPEQLKGLPKATLSSLQKRGLIDHKNELTPDGYQVYYYLDLI